MQPARYYGWLVTTLPTRQLALVAVRRLRRAAFIGARSVTRPFERPTDLTQTLNVGSLDEVAVRMRQGLAGLSPFDPRERQTARSTLPRLFPRHAQEVCERADRALHGELHLFGVWRAHARGELESGVAAVDWTRDPIHGGNAPDEPAARIEPEKPGFDARAIWEAGRMAHAVWFAQAHLLVGLPGTERCRGAQTPGLYARALSLHVRDFFATQPTGRGIHWTCAMEVALRAINIATALSLVRDEPSFDSPFWTEAGQLLFDHMRFIEEHLEDGQAVPGNHLLCDLAGLAVVSNLFPELPDAFERRRDAMASFAAQLLAQTTPEGLSFESSMPYHRFVTELALLVEAVARRQGLTLGAKALERLWLMCDVVSGATLSDGRLVQLGDNDSSRALAFTLRSPLDGGHVASLKTALGAGGTAAPVPEVAWLVGGSGLRRLQRSTLDAPLESFRASGLAVLRDGTRSASLWAGANGQMGLGGHAHNDKLSSEIVLGGRRLSVDPGCPVYLADLEARNRYRSTGMHPTVRIDGLEQSEIPLNRPFLLPDTCRAQLVDVNARRAVGEHRGWSRLRPPVVHRREVLLPEGNDAVLVTDRLLGEGEHVCEVQWPLTVRDVSMTRATAAQSQALERLETFEGEGRFDTERVFVIGGHPEAILAVACEQPWEASVEESIWSPGYGQRALGCTVRIVFHAPLPLAVTCAFLASGGLPGVVDN